jgi:WD40 repeat protein
MWLENGRLLAVVGVLPDRTAVVGFDTNNERDPFVIASDFGPVVPGGKIVDVVASPDGMTLAIAAIEPSSGHLNIVLHDVIAPDESSQVASFTGSFESVSVNWLDPHRIAVALRAPNPPSGSQADGNSPGSVAVASPSGLYVIDTRGLGSVERVNLECPLSRLSWNPEGTWAVGTGDSVAAPVFIGLRKRLCTGMRGGPINPLGWSPDGGSILYSIPSHDSSAVMRYDLKGGSTALIAIASSAAAWTSSGDILALGSQTLTWRAAQLPTKPWPAQLAMMVPGLPEVRILSLGIRTTAPLLAQSRIVYAQGTDMAAIDLLTPGPTGPLRRIIGYLQATRIALTLASGPALGPVLMSWSPDGRNLAILDSNLGTSVITVLSPLDELRARPPGAQFTVVGQNPSNSKQTK